MAERPIIVVLAFVRYVDDDESGDLEIYLAEHEGVCLIDKALAEGRDDRSVKEALQQVKNARERPFQNPDGVTFLDYIVLDGTTFKVYYARVSYMDDSGFVPIDRAIKIADGADKKIIQKIDVRL
ncbi:MAG: hypothetical protein WC730_03680 [Patescibacteria group bacterium]|jgi:hypothetical protein